MLGRLLALGMLTVAVPLSAQQAHEHPAPEQLGSVSFAISCKATVQRDFNKGVALLHSFAYSAADKIFRGVAERDPQCAMAHWGIAMVRFHQLWEPRIPADSYVAAKTEIDRAVRMGANTDRERQFILAASGVFKKSIPYEIRAHKYEQAMSELAAHDPHDVEVQVFYALALVSNADPSDKTHTRQKHAAAILEPIFRSAPNHPGIAHYLIHAYDNAELAPQGLPAARLYSKIAPSAPHALHMPSHIFTRRGLWEDSISANMAAREAAHRAGDVAEELHDMDYLVYAYLQLGREAEANQILSQLRSMSGIDMSDPKAAYAATAIPIRYAVERGDWRAAVDIRPAPGSPPQVTACAIWARALGLIRMNQPIIAPVSVEELASLEQQLQSSGNIYWAIQVRVMKREVMAWAIHAREREDDAVALLKQAADEEDSLEKLPVTPGPIIPAREQLGTLLLERNRPDLARTEFQRALAEAPGRRGSLAGLEQAETRVHHR
jgi:tetratricopeptide (TPR) repeat protein